MSQARIGHVADAVHQHRRTLVHLRLQVQRADEHGPPLSGAGEVFGATFVVLPGDDEGRLDLEYDLAWDRLVNASRMDLDLAA